MLTLQQREAKRAQKKYAAKPVEWPNKLEGVAGLFAFASAFYVMSEYNKAMVEFKWLLLTAVVFCLPVILFYNKRHYYRMMYWFLLSSLFFLINDTFADRNTFTVKRPIEGRSYRYKKNGPHAEITYKRISKEVYCDDDKTLADSRYAILTLSQGFFGVEIVRDKKLVAE